jgi:hypothetical protein
MLLMLKVATFSGSISVPASCWFCCYESFTIPGEWIHKSPTPTAQRSPRGSSLCPRFSQAYEIRELLVCPAFSVLFANSSARGM